MTAHDDNSTPRPPKPRRITKKGLPDRRNPPEEHRFKPGQPGNKNGRPRRVKTGREVVDAVLSKAVTITEGGRKRKGTLDEAIALRHAKAAVDGSVASYRELNRLRSTRPGGPEPEPIEVQEQRKALSAKLVDMLELMASLNKQGLIERVQGRPALASWIYKEAERRRLEGIDDPTPGPDPDQARSIARPDRLPKIDTAD